MRTSFLQTVRKADGERRYYIGGCRVSRSAFNSTGTYRRDCFTTKETLTHWHYRHEGSL